MHDGTYNALVKLRDEGSVPCSSLSHRTVRKLQPAIDAGVVVRRRRGRGTVLETADPAGLAAFTLRWFPHGGEISGVEAGIPERAAAVALFRDAKRSRRASAEPVLVRALAPVEAAREDTVADLFLITRTTGAACLLIDPRSPWRLRGSVAIVENLDVFLHFERLCSDVPVALYAGGRLSGRVIDWLASEAMGDCEYLHCGDYDPVGLDEYMRLHDRIGTRVRLHVPANIDDLFSRYGKRELLRDSAAILTRLRRAPLPEVRRLTTLMDATAHGLEQEALLIPPPTRQTNDPMIPSNAPP